MKRNLFLLGVLFSVLLWTPVFAQEGPPEDGPARKRLDDLRRIKLIEAVQLNEEQAIRFFARESEFKKQERELNRDRMEAIERLEKLVRSKASDQDILKEVAAVEEISKQIGEKRLANFNSIKEILTPQQLGRYLVFEARFYKEVRGFMQDAMRKRRRGGE